jgi:hypothetical protein
MTTETSKKSWGFSPVGEVLFKHLTFEPTGEEQAKILRSDKRFKLVAGGEQSGKSFLASKDFLLKWAKDLDRFPGEPLLYWLVAADYDRTKREFQYIAADLEAMGLKPEVTKRVDPGSISVMEGTKEVLRIETKSGKDPRTLAMNAPHGIILCEASQVDLETYNKCLARVAPKKGWLFLSGTYESSLGWYPGLAAAWAHGSVDEQSFKLPSPTNWHFYPGGLDNPEIQRLKSNSSDAFFLERIMGVAAPPKGMVFTEFRPDVHIREIEYVPGQEVFLAVDPGYAHAYAVEAIQIVNGMVNVIDEIYETSLVTEQVIEVCQSRPWWKDHSKTGVMDIGGYQHQAMSAPAEVWLARTGINMNAHKVKVNEGTERLKTFLRPDPINGMPKVVFSHQCRGILSEFGAYPNPFDGQTKTYNWKMDRDGNVVGDEPDDRNNDGIKALIYFLWDRFGAARGLGGGEDTFVMTRHGSISRGKARYFSRRR